MKTLEKHLLILEPLLEELAPLEYFRKGKQLWHINRQEGYAILIETELYSRGTYKNILVQYGSFWKDISASSLGGVSLGSMYITDDRCISFDTFGIETTEELDKIVRDSAPHMVNQVKQKVLPILRTIHNLPSFVKACETLDSLSTWIIWPRGERVWDYFALGDKARAFEYLRDQVQYAWRPVFEQALSALAPDEKEELRREHSHYDEQLDRLERQNRDRLQGFMDELSRLSDAELAKTMQERFTQSETALAAYIGPKRWKQI